MEQLGYQQEYYGLDLGIQFGFLAAFSYILKAVSMYLKPRLNMTKTHLLLVLMILNKLSQGVEK